jgi:hypothetical protein
MSTYNIESQNNPTDDSPVASGQMEKQLDIMSKQRLIIEFLASEGKTVNITYCDATTEVSIVRRCVEQLKQEKWPSK